MKIERNCGYCGKLIVVWRRLKDVNFCSRGCGTRYKAIHPTEEMKQRPLKRMTGKYIPCEKCGKLTYLPKVRINRLETGEVKHTFCSRNCVSIFYGHLRTGENGSNWKGGISIYPKSFRTTREIALEKDLHLCQGIGPHQGRLEVHHKDGNKHNSDPKNLITLCCKCHKGMHNPGLISVKCNICGKERFKHPSEIKRPKYTGLCASCQRIGTHSVTVKCLNCGVEFQSYPSLKRMYCSRDCQYKYRTGRHNSRTLINLK